MERFVVILLLLLGASLLDISHTEIVSYSRTPDTSEFFSPVTIRTQLNDILGNFETDSAFFQLLSDGELKAVSEPFVCSDLLNGVEQTFNVEPGNYTEVAWYCGGNPRGQLQNRHPLEYEDGKMIFTVLATPTPEPTKEEPPSPESLTLNTDTHENPCSIQVMYGANLESSEYFIFGTSDGLLKGRTGRFIVPLPESICILFDIDFNKILPPGDYVLIESDESQPDSCGQHLKDLAECTSQPSVLVAAGFTIAAPTEVENLSSAEESSTSQGGNDRGSGGGGFFSKIFTQNSTLLNPIIHKRPNIDDDVSEEQALDADGNPVNGFETYIDPDNSSRSIISIDGDKDGKTDHFIDIDRDGKPDKYWDPDQSVLVSIEFKDFDGDGAQDWSYESTCTGLVCYKISDRYFNPVTKRVGRILALGESCTSYLAKNIRSGARNDTTEVKKLQNFLIIEQGAVALKPTGTYDTKTRQAVIVFQEKYRKDVLPRGVARGTGNVLTNTIKKINQLYCSDPI